MSTKTAAELTSEIEAINNAVRAALLDGDIVTAMNDLKARIVRVIVSLSTGDTDNF